tara:strand:- start:1056 stop:1346 length:291 start_codon:yes stop_codon:yes gene_type:complete
VFTDESNICNISNCKDDGLSPGAIVGIAVGSTASLLFLTAVGAVVALALLARRVHHTPPVDANADLEVHDVSAHNEHNPLHDANHIVEENRLEGAV